MWLLGPGWSSKGLSPGSEIRLVRGLHVVEMGLIYPREMELIHPGEMACLGMGR